MMKSFVFLCVLAVALAEPFYPYIGGSEFGVVPGLDGYGYGSGYGSYPFGYSGIYSPYRYVRSGDSQDTSPSEAPLARSTRNERSVQDQVGIGAPAPIDIGAPDAALNRDKKFIGLLLGGLAGAASGLIQTLGRKRREVHEPTDRVEQVFREVRELLNNPPIITRGVGDAPGVPAAAVPLAGAPVAGDPSAPDNIQEEQELGEVLSVPLYLRCGPFNLLACFFPQAFIV